MNRNEVLYLAPYLIALVVSLGVFLYSWGHRYVRGARAFTWLAIGQTLTLLGFIFELISPSLEAKIFWNTFQWLTTSFLVILPFLFFTTTFSEHNHRYPALTWGLVLGFLLIFTALILTDGLHHLFYPNPQLSIDSPFPELEHDVSFVVFLYTLFYVYGANFYGISLLIRRAFQPQHVYRLQYLIIAAGFLIPLLFSFVALADIQITPQRDIMPLALTIGNLIAAWGLFRYGRLDIAPLAHKQMIENMNDPVIVLDSMNRIMYVNKAALRMMGKQSSEVIGRPFSESFTQWPIVVELLNHPSEQRREMSTKNGENILFFEISILPIFDDSRKLLGRTLVTRDITRHKTVQANYRKLSVEFEQQIRERTEELLKNAERYRAVVENETEFIVRWKPDGTRTFVNEAYCRYWDIPYEQGIARNFLFHIPEEDRPFVEAKISHLDSGVSNVETEIHQVIKPDGSIAWQEWTDHAIRDEWGNLIEIHSVGRDITERKQAEERLMSANNLPLEDSS
jgi:PAS domain S-box-containing protein